MALIVNSRKRTRSDSDHDFTLQSKQFIREQTINSNNQSKMKEIHGNFCVFFFPKLFQVNSQFQLITDKTIKMLFQNANPKSTDKSSTNNNNNNDVEMNLEENVQPLTKWQQFGDNICLMGDGQVNYIDTKSKFATENISRRCRFCAKPSSIQATDCINCNLEICEFCGISCMQCNAPLCMSCVQLL